MLVKSIVLLTLLLCSAFPSKENFTITNSHKTIRVPLTVSENFETISTRFYENLNNNTLSFQAFKEAITGYIQLREDGTLKNEDFLTIIDFTQPSSEKRFFLIDMKAMKIVHQTYCSHGRNSGGLYAKSFSNTSGGYQSSLGFYLTDNAYSGKFDIALRLDGLEKSNSRARERAIVMHGAEYATEQFLKKNNNVLGRSLGCPAVPKEEAAKVIHKIKNGSCVYIYHTQPSYRAQSKLIKAESLAGLHLDFELTSGQG